MKIADANIILRYLLNDHEELSDKATIIIENNEVLLHNEVIAEIVYVLEKRRQGDVSLVFFSTRGQETLFTDVESIEGGNLDRRYTSKIQYYRI